ncbi:MAG: glycosyltransferase [Gemmatimonadales bacterium]|nr:glycosyltransferase [Gemmatimonadales bacterium]
MEASNRSPDPVTPAAPRVLVLTNMYPDPQRPARGAFVKVQVDALRALQIPVDVMVIDGSRGWHAYAVAVLRLRQRIAQFRPDVIYAFYGLSGWVALWQSCPVVLSLAGSDILGSPATRGGVTLRSRAAILLSQWASHRAAHVCVQSREMRERLWGRALRARTEVVVLGVDPEKFRPGDQAEARRRLGLPDGTPLVIFPNTPTERVKRLDLAQAAMEIVRRQLPEVQLRIVTNVPHDTMPDYYRAADALLLTSEWEGFPNVVKEALLCGLPVVTTDVSDVRRWIPLSPESSVSSRDPSIIASHLVEVLRHRPRVDPVPFLQVFGSEAVTRRMLEILRAVVASRRK